MEFTAITLSQKREFIMQSILDERIYGLIYITGAYSVGKTTMATTLESPQYTAILDFDLKFKAVAERLGFWYKCPEIEQDVFNVDFASMADWLKKTLMEIPKDKTVVVIDNAAPLESILGYIASQDPAKYGVNPTNAQKGAYGGVNPGVARLWKNIAMFLQGRGVRVVVVVSHQGMPWKDGQPILNKFRGKGNKVLQELANLSLILVRTPSPYPAGIIVKEQFAQRGFTDGEWKIQRIFPLRFPRAEWKYIFKYFDEPANFANPQLGEFPSQAERDMYGELFTKEQIEFIKAVASGSYSEEDDAQFIPVDPKREELRPEARRGDGEVDAMTVYWRETRALNIPREKGQKLLADVGNDPVKALKSLKGDKGK
jgi:hypothetical protein